MRYSVVVIVFEKEVEDANVEAMRKVWSAMERLGSEHKAYTGAQSSFLKEIKERIAGEKDVKRVFIVENIEAKDVEDACKNSVEMCNMIYKEDEKTKGAVPFNAFEKIYDPIKKKRKWEEVLWFTITFLYSIPKYKV